METKTCKTCAHEIFEEVWGEYKCGKNGIRVPTKIFSDMNCKWYKKGEPSLSKREWGEDNA